MSKYLEALLCEDESDGKQLHQETTDFPLYSRSYLFIFWIFIEFVPVLFSPINTHSSTCTFSIKHTKYFCRLILIVTLSPENALIEFVWKVMQGAYHQKKIHQIITHAYLYDLQEECFEASWSWQTRSEYTSEL